MIIIVTIDACNASNTVGLLSLLCNQLLLYVHTYYFVKSLL